MESQKTILLTDGTVIPHLCLGDKMRVVALEPASLEALHTLFRMDLIALTVQLEAAILKPGRCDIEYLSHTFEWTKYTVVLRRIYFNLKTAFPGIRIISHTHRNTLTHACMHAHSTHTAHPDGHHLQTVSGHPCVSYQTLLRSRPDNGRCSGKRNTIYSN